MHGLLAMALQQQGRHDEASTHFLAALRSDPGMPGWLIGVAQSWKSLGMHVQAREALERALQSKRLSAELSAAVQIQLDQMK